MVVDGNVIVTTFPVLGSKVYGPALTTVESNEPSWLPKIDSGRVRPLQPTTVENAAPS